MKVYFPNEYVLETFLMNDNYYSWEEYSFDKTEYLTGDERIVSLKKQFPNVKNKIVTLGDIIRWKRISLRSRVNWIALEAMTKKELLLFTFELVKIVIPLDWKNIRTFIRVVQAGEKFFENKFECKELKEELHWVQNATQGVSQLCPVYPWVGHATDGFINALECELEGGYMGYWSLGFKQTYTTEHFLDQAIGSSFTAVNEIKMSQDSEIFTKKRMCEKIERLIKDVIREEVNK